MANQVTTRGVYISQAGGSIRRWEPSSYLLQAGEIGWDDYPTLANLQSVGQQGKVQRAVLAIYSDLKALTTTQQGNIWTDLTGSTPVKILNYTSGHSDSIFVMHGIVLAPGVPAALATDMKFRAAALYVQDHPAYLVNPPFDPTINVPGDQPA